MMDVDGATLSSGEQRWSLCVRGCLVASVYAITLPMSGYIYRAGTKQQLVRCMYSSSLFFILIHPIGLLQIHATRPSQSNAALATNGRYFGGSGRGSMHRHFTNASWHGRQRSFTSTQYGSPSLLLRWCEWTPLAGLMTFLAEAVDLPRRKSGIRVRIYSALSNPSVVCSESSSVLSQPHRGVSA
jgi:hypothetical protein